MLLRMLPSTDQIEITTLEEPFRFSEMAFSANRSHGTLNTNICFNFTVTLTVTSNIKNGYTCIPFQRPNRSNYIKTIYQVPRDYHSIPWCHGIINIYSSLTITFPSLIISKLSQIDQCLPFKRQNKTNYITRTLHVPWDYHFISRSHGTINNINLYVSTIVIQYQ